MGGALRLVRPASTKNCREHCAGLATSRAGVFVAGAGPCGRLGALPLPVWGEGGGKGDTARTVGIRAPSPTPYVASEEYPSPRRGEGTSSASVPSAPAVHRYALHRVRAGRL